MSEQDDIFDIDAFFKEVKAPKHIKRAWERHLRLSNEESELATKGAEVISALRTLKKALDNSKII